jgi:hypothetical protein
MNDADIEELNRDTRDTRYSFEWMGSVNGWRLALKPIHGGKDL